MRPLDKFEQIVFDSEVNASILGNESTADYELVPTSRLPLSLETQAEYHARGLCFLGTVGVVDGQVKTALAAPLDEGTTSALTIAFTKYITVDWLREKLEPKSDSLTWLEQLHKLPDPRSQN